jgi:thiol-disulfide isomerase/thioredoxin
MKSTKWIGWTLAAAVAWGLSATAARAETPATQPAPAAQKEAGEDMVAPAPAPAKVSPQAQAELDQIRTAYGKLHSLSLAGTVQANIDVNGQKQDQHATFTSSYNAPNQFRHEVPGEIIVGSTGQKAYIYSEKENQYLQADAPQGKVASQKLPPFVAGLLSRQNPSLLMALSTDAAAELTAGALTVNKSPDVKVGDESFTALQIETTHGDEHVLVNSDTHLLKQVKLDLSKMLKEQGAPNVKQAELTFDYTKTQPDAPVKSEQFAWSPPANATDAAKAPKQQPESAATDLAGKPAPDFTLTGLDGKEQTLSKMKGSVVVLDFWATWCPPCRESLPHLDALDKELGPKGLKVYAVNLQEEKTKVEDYIKKNNLSFKVLLDTQGKVAMEYKANAIPQTVVVAKDGTVKKVFVGFGPDTAKNLHEAVEEAMKK